MKPLAIVTVLFDYPQYTMPSFYKNALRYGVNAEDIHIQRYNESFVGSYYDKLHYYKIAKTLEYLIGLADSYQHILFMDALDTNFVKPIDEILDVFSSYGKDIVTCAEQGLWPPTEANYLYETKTVPSVYRYLNSGGIVGKTESVIKVLQRMPLLPGYDDQGAWAVEYLTSDDICIDYDQHLFFSTYLSKNKVNIQDGNRVVIDSDAFIIHDNGPYGEDTIKLTEILNANH